MAAEAVLLRIYSRRRERRRLCRHLHRKQMIPQSHPIDLAHRIVIIYKNYIGRQEEEGQEEEK